MADKTRVKDAGNGFKFVYVGDNDWPDHLLCGTCNKRVERGIFNISEHWAACFGKANYEATLKLANERKDHGLKLTLDDVDFINRPTQEERYY